MTDDVNFGKGPFYPSALPDLEEAELSRVIAAVRSTWIASTGEFLEEFEEAFGRACNVNHVIPVANGTVALHVILVALGIGPGDEVIVPSLTYIATANAVTYTGATPVFADISPTTWCINPEHVAALVTERTVAIIPVHLYGHPADMAPLRDIANRHSLALIEDAAEAPFASYRGQVTGSLGDVASFSFYGNKIITSGEGGAVTTNDAQLADRIRLLRGQGMEPTRRYYFPVVGYNYRLTNVAAALLCGQLSRLELLLQRRRALFAAYEQVFRGNDQVELQPIAPWAEPVPWLYTILIREASSDRRDKIMMRLAEDNIDTRPTFIPIHQLPPYAHHSHTSLEVTNDVGARGISLPTSSTWGRPDAEYIASRLFLALGAV